MALIRSIDTPALYDRAEGEETPKPHVEVTGYDRLRVVGKSLFGDSWDWALGVRRHDVPSITAARSDSRSHYCRAVSQQRLYSKARQGTELAETLAEMVGEVSNIQKGASRLIRSYKLLRRGKVNQSFKALGLNRPAVKSADALLAWEFGIKPTIGSISASVDYLQSPVPAVKVNSSAHARELTESVDPGDWGGKAYWTTVTEYSSYTGGYVLITNPNLALADSYGFLNPVKLAWDLVPMSFLVDYFVPVGRFLGAFSPLYGRSFIRGYQGSKIDQYTICDCRDKYTGEPVYKHAYRGVSYIRSVGVPSWINPLDVVDFSLPPIGAAATTVALAVKTFSK